MTQSFCTKALSSLVTWRYADLGGPVLAFIRVNPYITHSQFRKGTQCPN